MSGKTFVLLASYFQALEQFVLLVSYFQVLSDVLVNGPELVYKMEWKWFELKKNEKCLLLCLVLLKVICPQP